MDQRRFIWKSGSLSGAPIQGFLQPPITLDFVDPQIPRYALLSRQTIGKIYKLMVILQAVNRGQL
jgi:hypothetical protein